MVIENLKPDLRFPEFTDNWTKKLLSDFMTFKNGINASKENYGSGYKFINVLDIIQNDFITHDKIIGSVNIDVSDFNKNIVEFGDILFQRSSETREEVGQANVYLDNESPATFGGFVIRGKKKSDFDPRFMNYLLKTSKARNEITSKSGGSTRYNIGQNTLSKVIIHIPNTVKEQEKIGTFIFKTEKCINLLKNKKEALIEYKKGIIQKLFSQEIRFKDENGNDFPYWEEKKLGDICEKKSSNLTTSSLSSNYGKYKLYGATGFLKNIDFYNEEKPYISIIKDGAGIGRISLCEAKSSVLGTLDILKPKDKNNLYFIYIILSTIQFEKYATGSTIPHIYFKDYSKEKLKIPCIQEQEKIAFFLSSLDSSISHMNSKIESTVAFKQGLLQKMFV